MRDTYRLENRFKRIKNRDQSRITIIIGYLNASLVQLFDSSIPRVVLPTASIGVLSLAFRCRVKTTSSVGSAAQRHSREVTPTHAVCPLASNRGKEREKERERKRGKRKRKKKRADDENEGTTGKRGESRRLREASKRVPERRARDCTREPYRCTFRECARRLVYLANAIPELFICLLPGSANRECLYIRGNTPSELCAWVRSCSRPTCLLACLLACVCFDARSLLRLSFSLTLYRRSFRSLF